MKTLLFAVLLFVSCDSSEGPADPMDTLKSGDWRIQTLTENGEDQTDLWAETVFDFKGNRHLTITYNGTDYDASWHTNAPEIFLQAR